MPEANEVVEETVTETTEDQANKSDEQLGEGGLKALNAEREARKKAEQDLATARAALEQIEKDKLSDLEKAQLEAKEAREALNKVQTDLLRSQIASKHGIATEDAKAFLNGNDEATLTAQAERLAELSINRTTAPKPDLSQGARGTSASSGPAADFEAYFQSLKN